MAGGILFCGYYGHQNAGDDTFNAVSVWGAERFWDVRGCALLCQRLPTLPCSATAALPARSRFKGHAHLAAIAAAVRRGDVVYAGGSTLHAAPGCRDFSFYHAWLNRARRCRLAAIGVSIGPFNNPRERRALKDFLSRFSFLGLRDRRSFDLARDLGLGDRSRLTFDLAGLLPELRGLPPPAVETRIGVTLCRYESIVGGDARVERLRLERIYRTLAGLARELGDAVFRFYVFNSHPEKGDERITRAMARRLADKGCRCEVVLYGGDPVALWSDVASCRLLIGTRLHSAVFAYMAGVPFLLSEYHPKCGDFLSTVGYRGPVRAPAEFLPPARAVAAALSLLSGDAAYLPRLHPREAARRARLNFTALAPLYS